MADPTLKELQELTEAIEAGSYTQPKTVTSPVLQIKNMVEKYPQYFNQKAKDTIFNKKVSNLNLNLNGKNYDCRFFSASVAMKQEENLVKEMAEAFNDLSDKDMILGVLAGPSSLNMMDPNIDFETFKNAGFPYITESVFFFVHIDDTPENNEYIKAKYGDLEIDGSGNGMVKREY
jgi:hypothetical protein